MIKTPTLVAAVVGVFSATAAHAGVIAGPTLTFNDSGYKYSGIGFTANLNSTLTGFTFQNQGTADTVNLWNSTGLILQTVSIPASTPPLSLPLTGP